MKAAPWIIPATGARLLPRPPRAADGHGSGCLVAGIVNVTPDSFHDGGRHNGTDAAVAHARQLAAQGAHVLDIGGESTRPGAAEVDAAQEQGRVVPVLHALARQKWPAGAEPPVLSVDTRKASVAAAAFKAGAAMVNDVSAAMFDPAMADVLAQHRPAYVCMHFKGLPQNMQDNPRYGDVVDEVLAFFENRLKVLIRAGLPEEAIALDPGIGFGKTLHHNLALLQNLERLAGLGRPLYVGLSNKSMWSMLLGVQPDGRELPTAMATALLAARGVAVHRVHNVSNAVQALAVAAALQSPEPAAAAGGVRA